MIHNAPPFDANIESKYYDRPFPTTCQLKSPFPFGCKKLLVFVLSRDGMKKINLNNLK